MEARNLLTQRGAEQGWMDRNAWWMVSLRSLLLAVFYTVWEGKFYCLEQLERQNLWDAPVAKGYYTLGSFLGQS